MNDLGGWQVLSSQRDTHVIIVKPTGERALVRKTLVIDLLRALFDEFSFKVDDTEHNPRPVDGKEEDLVLLDYSIMEKLHKNAVEAQRSGRRSAFDLNDEQSAAFKCFKDNDKDTEPNLPFSEKDSEP